MGDARIFRIHCQLRGTQPPIWRNLLVPADLHLDSFHEVLQAAMGWYDGHFWQFSVGDLRYRKSVRKPRSRLLVDPLSKAKAPVSMMVHELLRQVGDTGLYEYDLDDGWEVDLRLEAIQEPDPQAVSPRCFAGELAAPPDDCGGLPGFELLKEALADPQHPEHTHSFEMTPEGWNASVCDVAAINADMPTTEELYRGDDDPDAEDEAEAAALSAVFKLRIRNEQHELLRTLLVEHPTTHSGPATTLDRAEPHKKGRVIRAERRVWNHFLALLEGQEESDNFQRSRQARELRALIAETR